MNRTLILATLVFVVTVVLVIWHPRRINSGAAALIGAAVALMLGLVSVADIWVVAAIVWNATAALIGIVLISAALDKAGFFTWAALHVAQRAGGNGRRLFMAVIILAATVSTFFTNDGTVLILTPIVWETLRTLGFSSGSVLAFLFACGFVADTVSTPLVVSNLVNIMSADYFHISYPRYMALMALPSLASLAASAAILFWLYQRHLPARFSPARLANPTTAIRDPRLFHMGLTVVVLLVPVFFIGAAYNIPVSIPIGVAALLLLVTGHRRRVFNAVELTRSAPWHVIAFAMGMYLVVYALRNGGLVAALALWLRKAAANNLTTAVLATGGMAAALSSLMNNLPATMTGILTVDTFAREPVWREALALANVIGCDLGPKLTPIGSLATLLWMHELQKRGVSIDWRYYLKIGIIATPPVLLAALLSLALVAGWPT